MDPVLNQGLAWLRVLFVYIYIYMYIWIDQGGSMVISMERNIEHVSNIKQQQQQQQEEHQQQQQQ